VSDMKTRNLAIIPKNVPKNFWYNLLFGEKLLWKDLNIRLHNKH